MRERVSERERERVRDRERETEIAMFSGSLVTTFEIQISTLACPGGYSSAPLRFQFINYSLPSIHLLAGEVWPEETHS